MVKLLFKNLATFTGIVFLLLLIPFKGKGQGNPQKRFRENFDFSWQFHKGNIAMKKVVKAGGQGGITDAWPKIII